MQILSDADKFSLASNSRGYMNHSCLEYKRMVCFLPWYLGVHNMLILEELDSSHVVVAVLIVVIIGRKEANTWINYC